MDQDEFTAFYRETAPAMHGYIRRVSGEGEAADDLLQETYLRFLRAKPAADDHAAMKAYLYKTATAAIYDRWRKHRRERLWSLTFRFREEAARTPAKKPASRPEPRRVRRDPATQTRIRSSRISLGFPAGGTFPQ